MVERKVYIDYVKAFAILLVITYHCHFFDSYVIFQVVLGMCVPLFFAVNGVLLMPKGEGYKYYIPRMGKCLFLIVFWGALSCMFSAIVYQEAYSIKQCISDVLHMRIKYCNHLWFLCTLFILYGFYPLLFRFFDDFKSALLFEMVLCCFTLQGLSSYLSNINPFSGWHSYALTYAVGSYILSQISIKSKLGPIVIFSVTIIGQVILNSYQSGMENTAIIFSSYKTPFIFMATLALVKFSSMVNFVQNKYVLFVSKNTLGIYLVHIFMTKLVVIYSFPGSINILIPFVVLGISCLVCYILNKNEYLKWLISL